jgi:hypothetical protein
LSDSESEVEWSSSEAESAGEGGLGNSDTDSDSSDRNNATPAPAAPIDLPWVRNGVRRPPFPFTGQFGVKLSNLSKNNILGIFESFFTDELINTIIDETNRYANQFINQNRANFKEGSRVKAWTDTNLREIRTYLGLLIL